MTATAKSAPRRGRRRRDEGPVLDRERLVRTLLEIAAKQGVAGLQMRTVSKMLGVSPKVLYNHVMDKRGMLDILVEAIMAESMPDLSVATWDERMREMARALRRAYRPYPGILEAVLGEGADVLQRPYTLWFHATALGALAEVGLCGDEAYEVFVRFAVLVMGSVLYGESTRRSVIPTESDEMLDRVFEKNLDMFLREVEQIHSTRGSGVPGTKIAAV
jgi:TetR/AcrR family transcriptional regulator, tetracycline repressor protein